MKYQLKCCLLISIICEANETVCTLKSTFKNKPFDLWHRHVAATSATISKCKKTRKGQKKNNKNHRINKKQCQQCCTNCVTGSQGHPLFQLPFRPSAFLPPQLATCSTPGRPLATTPPGAVQLPSHKPLPTPSQKFL